MRFHRTGLQGNQALLRRLDSPVRRPNASALTTAAGVCSKSILGRTQMTEKLQELIDAARNRQMSDSEQEQQLSSFAYGNAHIENARVTRAMVDEAAEKRARERKG